MNLIHGKKQTNKKNQCLHFKLKDENEVNNTFPIPCAKEIPSGARRNLALVGFTEGKKNPPAVKELLIQVATLISWRMRRYLPLKKKEKQGESLTLKAQQSTQIPVKPTQVRAENCNSRVVTITAS